MGQCSTYPNCLGKARGRFCLVSWLLRLVSRFSMHGRAWINFGFRMSNFRFINFHVLRCYYVTALQDIEGLWRRLLRSSLLEYSWLVTFVVTIFFWSPQSLVFEVFAMASRHSLSSSRCFFFFLQSFCWCILKIKAKITNRCLRKHLAFLFCWRYKKPLTSLTLAVTVFHTFYADVIAFEC